MHCRVMLVVLALSFAQGSVAAQATAADWLARMVDSHRTLNYRGVVTYKIDDQLNSFKVSHSVRGGREYEVLEMLEGGESEVIREGHDVNCVHPGPELLRLLVVNPSDARSLQQLYSLSVGDNLTVAGRDAVAMRIEPRDVYRLGYRLALDRETGLLLRSEIINKNDKVLERFEYVVLDLSAGDGEQGDANAKRVAHSRSADDSNSSPRDWQLSWLPPGFTPLRGADQQSISYTDGLAVFSVFIEPLAPDQPFSADSHLRRGASVSYSTVLKQHGKLVSVVGEVPMLTARQVARSVTWGAP